MKKPTINLSWPVVLSDFSKNENKDYEIFSRCKLRVFYKGETADHRYFSDEFAEQLVKSLPYTPVVSRFDSEKEDFEGHASRQEIFGMVDPCAIPTFEEDEEGKTWCVADIVLYTERPDELGEIAKQIPGHPHSLELDPSTTKYRINYDEKKHFKNIEFTAGSFVGVSVLGMDQKPAFTGSAFFAENSEFIQKMEALKNYCESQKENQHGGDKMDFNQFIKLTWGDISGKVNDKIFEEYGEEYCFYIADMYDDATVCVTYSYIDGNKRYLKFYYTIDENGVVSLGKVEEVYPTWEVIPSSEPEPKPAEPEPSKEPEIDMKQTEDENDPEEDVQDSEEPEEEEKPLDHNLNTVDAATSVENEDNTQTDVQLTDAALVANVEGTTEVNENPINESECEHENNKTEDSSSTSFTNSEREEYENLKKAKKIQIVDTYKEVLTDEEYNNFINSIDNFSEQDLEFDLLKIYKRVMETEEKTVNTSRGIGRAFSVYAPENKNTENPLDAFVRKNLRR